MFAVTFRLSPLYCLCLAGIFFSRLQAQIPNQFVSVEVGDLPIILAPPDGGTGDQPKNLRFASNRPLKRAELGQWHTLAVVHDPVNKRVRHYLDGALVRENPLDDSHPLKLRQLVIGNWGFNTEPRNFAGRMDELAVFKRALSDDEISKF